MRLQNLGHVVLDARRLASGFGWTVDLGSVRDEAARHNVEGEPARQREVAARRLTITDHTFVEEADQRANAPQ